MLKFSRTSHVHIVLLKLSNCCTWRCQLWPHCWDLNPVDYQVRPTMHECVNQREVHSNNELKQWPIQFWCSLDEHYQQGYRTTVQRLSAFLHVKGSHFEHTVWTNSFTQDLLCVTDVLKVSKILYFTTEMHNNVDIMCTVILLGSAAMPLRWGGRFYTRYVQWSFLIGIVKKW